MAMRDRLGPIEDLDKAVSLGFETHPDPIKKLEPDRAKG